LEIVGVHPLGARVEMFAKPGEPVGAGALHGFPVVEEQGNEGIDVREGQ
jgi:hypothetical protein